MRPPEDVIADAKGLMGRRDFTAALSLFETIDQRTLPPEVAVRMLVHMSTSAMALGRRDLTRGYQQTALDLMSANGLLAADRLTPDTVKLAVALAVGAGDAVKARKYLRMLFGTLPPSAETFEVSWLVDLPRWCRDHSITVHPLDAPATVDVDDGRGIGQTVHYETERTWYADIPDAEVIGGWDFVRAATDEVLTGASYFPVEKTFPFMPHAYSPTAAAVAHVWPQEVMTINDPALFVSTPERHHYGHWIADFLPRLKAWDKAAGQKLVISAALPQKHRDLLARFGATANDLIELSLGQRAHFKSLRVVRTGRAVTPSPHDARFLAATLQPSLPVSPHGAILFLVRDAGTRLPANRDEVDAVFREFGVVQINPARLSLSDQEALFATSRAIIGAFGTELYCLYSMPRGATVIELIWDAAHATVYGPVCASVGINHHLIVCERAEARGQATYKQDSDLIIDCEALRQRLAALT